MRYLWVEDFDGGKTGQNEIRRTLEKYFQLDNKSIIKRTLEETLTFLDDPANWKLFDAILIDIRFKVCNKENDEKEIYEKYFSDFLTEEKYNTYTYKIREDANTASSGVLLYLALIHKYNYNHDRIAFVSANVDESSDQLADINNMREYICKAKYSDIDEDDKNNFSTLNENVFELFCDVLEIDEKKANEIFSISKTDDIDWNNIDRLEKQINEVAVQLKKCLQKKHENEDVKVDLKYNSIKEEFENVGLKLPLAFEKPGGTCQPSISWKFRIWVEELLSFDYYRLRTSVLPICIEVSKQLNDEQQRIELNYDKLRMSYNGDDVRTNYEKTAKIKCMLDELIESFPENINKEKITYIYTRIIRDCVSLCDEIRPDKKKKSSQTALESVLKIVRNWISHQGINGIKSYDVAFVFYAMVSTFFGCKYLNDAKKILLSFDGEDNIEIDYGIPEKINKMKEIAKSRHCDAYKRYTKNVGEEKAAKNKKYSYREDANLYDVISAIGNEFSDLREKVSMNYVYLLYLGMLDENEYGTLESIIVKRLEKSCFFEE